MSDDPANDPDGTQAVDLDEVEVSNIDVPPTPRTSGPPPLPPEVRASAAPSMPPPSPSMPPPAPRSNAFYIGLVVGFVVVGIGVGIAVARNVKSRETPAPVSVSIRTAPTPTASVMTLPTIDMSDEDGGK